MQTHALAILGEADQLAIGAAQAEAAHVLGQDADWAPRHDLPATGAADPVGLAAMIDHTILRPSAQRDDILRMCDEVAEYGFFGICVNPLWVATAAQRLSRTPAAVIAVIAFPLGATPTRDKQAEALAAVGDGATELDMVASLGSLRSGDPVGYASDVEAVVSAAANVPVKVIIESGLLRDAYERAFASCLATLAGAAYVKTSTGFAYDTSAELARPLGAAAADVAVMASAVGQSARVKASGGIRSYQQAIEMIRAGASRIGTSSGPKIVAERDLAS
jgi:deoxyribose-phosphate aldolase